MADATIDELKIKVSVDTSELDNFKRSASSIGTSFTESMNKGLRNFNTRTVVKRVQSDANSMAQALSEQLTRAFIIDDKYAKDEVRKLTQSLVDEMQAQFKTSGHTVSKSVDELSSQLVESIKRNGHIVETESGEYKQRLTDFYKWFTDQGQIRLPKGFNNPALESLPVFGGKFSKNKGMDLTNQNALRESFSDLFDTTQLDNQEDAVNRVIELIKEYKTTVETIKPISSVFDADNQIWGEVVSGIESVSKSLKDDQKYVEGLRRAGFEAGKSFNFEGGLEQSRKKLTQLENELSVTKARFSERNWGFGTQNFENAITKIGRLEGMIESVKRKIEGFTLGNIDDSDFDVAYQRMLDRIESEKAYEEEVTEEFAETTRQVKGLDTALASSLGIFRDMSSEYAKAVKNAKEWKVAHETKIPGDYVPKELKEGQRYTKEYLDLAKAIDSATKKLDGLYNRQEKADSLGASKSSYSYRGMTYEIQKAEKEVDNLTAKMERLQAAEGDVEDIDFGKTGNGARRASGFMTQLASALRGAGFRGAAQSVSSLGRNFANLSASAEGATGAMAGLGSAIPIIGAVGGAIFIVVNALKKVMSVVAKVGSAIGKAMKKAVESTVSLVKALFGVGQGTNAISRLYNKFLMTLRNRGISKIVMQLFSQAKESMQSLAAFSNRIGSDFNKNISSLISNFKLLGNSLAAAFEPLVNVVTPYLDFLMQKLVDAINVVNQFFNALTGNSTWTKAIYQATNYGASVGDATKAQKELNKQLQSFDELNNISENKGSGGGSGSGATSINPNAFTTEQINSDVSSFAERFKKAWEAADFTEIGFDFGTAIKNSLDGIDWGEIEIAAGKVGKSLATFINGGISVDGLAETLGKTLAGGINTFITGIHGFVTFIEWDGIGTFVGEGVVSAIEEIKWDRLKSTAGNLGEGLASGINALLDTDVLSAIGKATGNLLKTGVEGWWKFVTTLEFPKLGDKIGDSINSFFKTMGEIDKESGLTGWQKLGDSISKTLIGFGDTISAALNKIEGEEVTNAVKQIWEKIDKQKIADSLKSAIGAAVDLMGEIVIGSGVGDNKAIKFICNIAFGKTPQELFDDWKSKWTSNDSKNNVSITNKFSNTASDLWENFKKIMDRLNPSVTIGNRLGKAAADLFGDFLDDWNLSEKIVNIGISIKQQATELWDSFKTAWGESRTVQFFLKLGSVIKELFDSFKEKFEAAGKVKFFVQLGSKISEVWGNFKSLFEKQGESDQAGASVKVSDKTSGSKVFTSFKNAWKKASKNKKLTVSVTSKNANVTVGATLKSNTKEALQSDLDKLTISTNVEGRLKYLTDAKGNRWTWDQNVGRWRDSKGQVGDPVGYYGKALGGIFNGGWKSIAQFANGGIPTHGTQFIAGEKGPEVVGHIGRRTEVLNQSQLASTMYSAVLAAMTQANGNGGQPIQVLLDGKVVFDNTRQRAIEYYRRTGNSAFAY